MDTDCLPTRMLARDDIQRDAIPGVIERRHDDHIIRNLVVGVACRQSLSFHHKRPRIWKLRNASSGRFESREVID